MALFNVVVAAAVLLACGFVVVAIGRSASAGSAQLERVLLREVLSRLPATIELLISSIVVSLVFCLLLSWAASKTGNGTLRRPITALVLVLQSVPFFWLALCLSLLAAVHFGESVYGWAATNGSPVASHTAHLILLACIAALAQIPIVVSVLDSAAAEDGAKFDLSTSLYWAALALAQRLPEVIAACLITELAFAWPGEGRLFFRALNAGQLPVAVSILIVLGWITLCFRAAVRCAALLSPRAFQDV